ncbi:MAG: DUF6715 family protein [Butyrivibrio sp.]
MKVFEKIKKPLIITLLAALAVSYYIYLSNRDTDKSNGKEKETSVATAVLQRDMEKNYPGSPRAVVTYFADIQKLIYKNDFDDDEFIGLAQHMLATYDDELLEKNPYELFIENLKTEISTYKSEKQYISQYIVEDGYGIELTNFKGDEYAEVDVKYYVRNDTQKQTIAIYEKYTLRKDSKGQWKILYWDLADGKDMEGY